MSDALDDLDPHHDIERETLEPEHIVGDAALHADRGAGYAGRRTRSIMTDGQESYADLIIDGDRLTFTESAADMIGSTDSFDEAVSMALRAQGAVVIGDPLKVDPFIVWSWPEAMDGWCPAATQADISPDVGLVVVGGQPLFPAHPVERTVRWVTVPGLPAYYAMSEDLQRWVRQPMEAAWKRADTPDIGLDIEQVPFPTLRLLIASHPSVVPVKKVVRKGVDRGGVTYGVTRPYLTADMGEPEIYVPVISMKEGNVDAINAWDLDAGISLGPVQYNVINGHLFATLLRVQQEDPELFAACFRGLGWTAGEVDGRPALKVRTDDGEVTLMSKRGEDRSGIRYNAGYFQAGEAGKWGLSKIDGDFRRDLTARFRNLVLWPHVQHWILEESGAYLKAGCRRMDRAEVPAVDPAALTPSAYTLRALLMSGFVRYGASLRLTLKHLAGTGSADANTLLGRLPRALDKVAGTSDAWADRVANLRKRYYGKDGKGGQQAHARKVLSMRG